MEIQECQECWECPERQISIKCHTFSEPQAQADLTDDGNFMNGGPVRNVGNVRKVKNVRNVLIYLIKPYHPKYHQISNKNKTTSFQPVADIVLVLIKINSLSL